jgi:hypothetical protein
MSNRRNKAVHNADSLVFGIVNNLSLIFHRNATVKLKIVVYFCEGLLKCNSNGCINLKL